MYRVSKKIRRVTQFTIERDTYAGVKEKEWGEQAECAKGIKTCRPRKNEK